MTTRPLNTEWLTHETESLRGLSVAIWWVTNMVFWISVLLVPASILQGEFYLMLGALGAMTASSWIWMRQTS